MKRAVCVSRLPPEPEPGDTQAIHVMLRTPGGERMERRFFASDKLQVMVNSVSQNVDQTFSSFDCPHTHIYMHNFMHAPHPLLHVDVMTHHSCHAHTPLLHNVMTHHSCTCTHPTPTQCHDTPLLHMHTPHSYTMS